MLASGVTAGVRVAGSVVSETCDELLPFQPDRDGGTLARRYTDEDSAFVTVDGTPIHYREQGDPDGPTLLLVHGTYSSLHTWDGWVDELADDFRLVRLDMPGFGLTGPRSEGDHTLEGLIETVGAFCDTLGLSSVAVAGNSLGGAVAWRLSIDRPDLVSRVILIDAGGATLLSKLAHRYTLFGSDLLPRYLTPRAAVRLIVRDAYGDRSKVTPELVRRYHDLLLRPGNRRAVIELARNYQRDHGERGGFDLLSIGAPTLPSNHDHAPDPLDGYDIEDVPVPALFQWGTEDEWLPPSFGRELAARTPDAVFYDYEGVGHIPMEEAPVATAADAAAFLE
jgi:pimeloyl-ACP methyl ester carboxylesterase